MKLVGIAGMIAYFTKLGFSATGLTTWFITLLELIGGVAENLPRNQGVLARGFALDSPVAGSGMSVVSWTAIWHTERHHGLTNSTQGGLPMKRLLSLLVASFFVATVAIAAEPKDYQVTGPVLDVKEDIIVVQKGDEKWEIGRDKGTKIKGGDLKKGSRVTIQYKMIASSIDVKDAGDAKTGTKTKGEDKKAASKAK